VKKNYISKDIKASWYPDWAKQPTAEMIEGNEPYMEWIFNPNYSGGKHHLCADGSAATDRYYDFTYGSVHAYIENDTEFILEGEIIISDEIKIWTYNPFPVEDYTEFTIFHRGQAGKEIHYTYSFSRDAVANYSAMNENHDMIEAWRELDRDDIEFIESVLNTELPNCRIGNLLIKQCRDLWESKHPRKEY